MATIENVHLSITQSASAADQSVISYSYELHPDEQDAAERREFTVTAALWGEDALDDDVLETDLDQHTVRLADADPGAPVPVKRAFEVKTKLLDEDLFGDDEVFLIVEAMSGHERVSARSNTVVGDF